MQGLSWNIQSQTQETGLFWTRTDSIWIRLLTQPPCPVSTSNAELEFLHLIDLTGHFHSAEAANNLVYLHSRHGCSSRWLPAACRQRCPWAGHASAEAASALKLHQPMCEGYFRNSAWRHTHLYVMWLSALLNLLNPPGKVVAVSAEEHLRAPPSGSAAALHMYHRVVVLHVHIVLQ